jgi:hypothetical protein
MHVDCRRGTLAKGIHSHSHSPVLGMATLDDVMRVMLEMGVRVAVVLVCF